MPLTFEEKIERAICEMADWKHAHDALVYADAAVPDDIDDTAPRELVSYQPIAVAAQPRTPAEPPRA